jgi:hypothetical protein
MLVSLGGLNIPINLTIILRSKFYKKASDGAKLGQLPLGLGQFSLWLEGGMDNQHRLFIPLLSHQLEFIRL